MVWILHIITQEVFLVAKVPFRIALIVCVFTVRCGRRAFEHARVWIKDNGQRHRQQIANAPADGVYILVYLIFFVPHGWLRALVKALRKPGRPENDAEMSVSEGPALSSGKDAVEAGVRQRTRTTDNDN